MALFADGQISTIEDLRQYETNILDMASVENVDLNAKLGLAEMELEGELEAYLRNYGRHSAKQVVVNDAIRRWHRLRTLSLVYMDVYLSQLNDRYLGKWREYRRRDEESSRLAFQLGIGIVVRPIPRGSQPKLSLAPGGFPPAVYYAQATWVDGRAVEGAPSALTALIASEAHQLTASMAMPPDGVAGWNIYVGSTPSITKRQNSTPIGAGAVWQMPASGLAAGAHPPEGQQPDYVLHRINRLRRG
ncbi:MAG: hypothetical protein ACK5AZ_11645 [Bryobacteraceae bacterium]